jgi:hypothetical protein
MFSALSPAGLRIRRNVKTSSADWSRLDKFVGH